jgi:hypothetical protein
MTKKIKLAAVKKKKVIIKKIKIQFKKILKMKGIQKLIKFKSCKNTKNKLLKTITTHNLIAIKKLAKFRLEEDPKIIHKFHQIFIVAKIVNQKAKL